MIGELIAGKFRIVEDLGSGGMGRVYKAEQIDLNRTVAIKILHPEITDTNAILKEAKVLAGLRDKYIVEVFSVGELSDGSLYLVMEYVEGKTLSRIVFESGHLPESRVVNIGLQICQAIRTLHSQKIIHRDLKSANVILRQAADEELVKVLDFGLSKKFKSEHQHKTSTETKTGMLIGTVDYMSPEVCSGQKATEASDIYALGCILFECLTGRLPFVCDNWVGLIYKHQHEQAPKPSTLQAGISSIIDTTVLKCLAKNPSDRFSVSELQEHLQRIQCGAATEVLVSGSKGQRVWIKTVASIVVFGLIFCVVANIAHLRESRNQNLSKDLVMLDSPSRGLKARRKSLDTASAGTCFETLKSLSSEDPQPVEEMISICSRLEKIAVKHEDLFVAYQMHGKLLNNRDEVVACFENALHHSLLSADGQYTIESMFPLYGLFSYYHQNKKDAQQEELGEKLVRLADKQKVLALPSLNCNFNISLLAFGNDIGALTEESLSDYYYRKGNLKKCILYGERAIADFIDVPVDAYILVSKAYSATSRKALAIKTMESLEKRLAEVEIDVTMSIKGKKKSYTGLLNASGGSKLVRDYFALAEYQNSAGKKSEAIKTYKKILEVAPQFWSSRYYANEDIVKILNNSWLHLAELI